MDDARRRGAARLSLRWPQVRISLRLRIKHDENFAELCEAYEIACNAAEYWLHSNSSAAAARVEEYQALAAATEQDILDVLHKAT
jgi:hypothetical protein